MTQFYRGGALPPNGGDEPGGEDLKPFFAGARDIILEWPGLKVEYAWMPPFEGYAVSQPNRLKAVFSAHSGVAMELRNRVHDIAAPAGTMYVVGAEPTVLLNVPDYSDTLNIYPDMTMLCAAAEMHGIAGFELEPTLKGKGSVTLPRDAGVLGAAHVLRRACMGRLMLSDIEASSLAHLLAERLLAKQYSGRFRRPKAAGSRLSESAVHDVVDFIEESLTDCITLENLARRVGLSPFHFARCFRITVGLAPHQYVLARRIEYAKRLLMTTELPVREIAWAIGFENISHFRRQFAAHIGIVPGELRRATRM